MARPKRTAARPETNRDGYTEFPYNGFTVVVPRSILQAWEAQSDKQEEMIKVVRELLARMRRKPITEGIRLKLEFGRIAGIPLSKTAEKMMNRGVKKAVLELLKYENYRDWQKSPIRDDFTRAVAMAALDGDQAFFKRLGEILKKPCKPARISKLKDLLLLNWIGEGICFCWFTDSALLNFIKFTEKDGAPFAVDAIRQERDRLGLPKLKPAIVRSIKQDGERILLSRAKPPRTRHAFHSGFNAR
jgi:hypothetical protein